MDDVLLPSVALKVPLPAFNSRRLPVVVVTARPTSASASATIVDTSLLRLTATRSQS
jgi:hypothetical protein